MQEDEFHTAAQIPEVKDFKKKHKLDKLVAKQMSVSGVFVKGPWFP